MPDEAMESDVVHVPARHDPWIKMLPRMLNEFIGTYFLCTAVTMGVRLSQQGAAVGIASMLTVMVYAGGYASGAHYNPAITIAVWLRGKTQFIEVVTYVAAQIAGSMAAGLVGGRLLLSDPSDSVPGDGGGAFPQRNADISFGQALLAEAVVACMLCYVVLNATTTRSCDNNSYFGLAIGSTVLSGYIAIGPVSGGAFNPAVGMLPLMFGTNADVGIYWLGPVIGAVVAALLFRVTNRGFEFGSLKPAGSLGQPLIFQNVQTTAGKFINEFVGTFYFAFIACMVSTGNGASTDGSGNSAGGASTDPMLAALAIGSALTASVYAGGHISGGHYNPAVTLALYLRNGPGHLSIKETLFYMTSQMGAGFAAAGVADCLGGSGFPYPHVGDGAAETYGFNKADAVTAEALGAFALVYVICHTATAEKVTNNHYFGVAIGMTAGTAAFTFGPISGGSFNPAVATALDCVHGSTDALWIYWVGPVIGALLATLCFLLVNPTEQKQIAFDGNEEPAEFSVTDMKLNFYGDGGRHPRAFNTMMHGHKATKDKIKAAHGRAVDQHVDQASLFTEKATPAAGI